MADNVEILNKESEENRLFFRFVGQGESKKRGKQSLLQSLFWFICLKGVKDSQCVKGGSDEKRERESGHM